jgi:hypothetical protein
VDQVPARGGPDAGRSEPRGLDQDVFGRRRNHGVVPSHDAGEAQRLALVGDHQIVGNQRPGGAVQQPDLLARVGAAHHDAALDLVQVEDVVGMAHAEQHEVRDVDRVRDRFLPEFAEVMRDDALGGRDRDAADNLRGKASAQVRRLDADGERLGRRGLGQARIERVQRHVVDGRRLAGDAVVVHGVDAVGGDVHVEERGFGVAGDVVDLEDAFDGDAAQGQVFGELSVIDVQDREIGAEPFGKDFHDIGLRRL